MPRNDILTDLRGIIWDLDNTLYKLDRAVEQAFCVGIAKAAIAAGAPLELDSATRLAQESFNNTGYSGNVFIDRYGVDPLKLHLSFHDYIDENVVTRYESLHIKLRSVKADHIILTHGSRPWAEKVVRHLGLADIFPRDRIIPMEDYDFQPKHSHHAGFKFALDRIGHKAADTIIVEDTMKNLAVPHALGMKTAFLHHGRIPTNLPDFVHWHDETADHVLNGIISAQKDKD